MKASRLLLAIALALAAESARATVALDAVGTVFVQNTATNTSDSYTGLTVGTGVNRALICHLGTVAAVTGVTLVWDSGGTNQSMTLIKSQADGSSETTFLYGLVNPISGNKTMLASWTTGSRSQVNCVSFTGASQVGGTTTFYGATGANGSGSSTTITCGPIATGDIVVDAIEAQQALSAPTQTSMYIGSGGTTINIAGSRANGAGANVTFGWTLGGSVVWADVCAGILNGALCTIADMGAGPC